MKNIMFYKGKIDRHKLCFGEGSVFDVAHMRRPLNMSKSLAHIQGPSHMGDVKN